MHHEFSTSHLAEIRLPNTISTIRTTHNVNASVIFVHAANVNRSCVTLTRRDKFDFPLDVITHFNHSMSLQMQLQT